MVTPGQVLGDRYTLEEQIASGGMGTVFRARDDRLGRTVAIKILRHDLALDERVIERFRREARSAASLSHPNVATVFDYGEDDGTHFIAMDFVDGDDLARVIREDAPMPEARAALICAQICDALGHAHERGIVHRDIKPGNVMVTQDDRVKVTDFGIARAAGESTLTATGSVLGTAQYLSPEQANGLPASAASDLYALGVVLYEMLTGSVPFTGDSAVAVAMRHLNEDVPAPSALNSSVGPRMDAIVARATRRNPADRYPSVAQMADDLRNLDGAGATAVLPVAAQDPARPTAPLPVTASPLARRAGLATAATLLLLVLVAAALAFARAGDSPRESARRAPAAAAESTVPEPTVPDLLGWSKSDAEQELADQGFQSKTVAGEQSPYEPKDVVYAMDPPPGEAVPADGTITLFVGTGEALDKDEDEDKDDKEDEKEDEEDEDLPPGQLKKKDKGRG